jgi:hypothetical protein
MLLAWAVGTAGSLLLMARPTTTPIVEDEVYWIGSSYYYNLAFLRHDFKSPDWDLLPARENPPIAKYVIGLALSSTGHPIDTLDLLGSFYAIFESVPHAWGEGRDYEKRAQVVSRMSVDSRQKLRQTGRIELELDSLLAARHAVVVCAIFASLSVFIFGTTLGSDLAGLLASQLLLFHPAVVDAYNHALSDAVALFFSCAAALAGYVFLREIFTVKPVTTRKGLGLSLLVGFAMALACGAKMNSLVIVLLFGMTLFILTAQARRLRDRATLRRLLGYGTVAFLASAGAFVLSNPAILKDLSGGIVACFQEHKITEGIQAQFLGDHLVLLGQKFSTVASLTYFGLAGFSGFIAILAFSLIFHPRRKAQLYVAGWWSIAFLCVTLWIPFPRERYIMPLVAPSVLLFAQFAVRQAGLLLFRAKTLIAPRLPSASSASSVA